MCCAFELSMCLFGLVVLVRGQFELSGGKTVSGLPACLVGILLLATGPSVAAVTLATWFVAAKQLHLDGAANGLLAIAEWVIVLGILLAASLIALLSAQKPELPPAEAARRMVGAALDVPPPPDEL